MRRKANVSEVRVNNEILILKKRIYFSTNVLIKYVFCCQFIIDSEAEVKTCSFIILLPVYYRPVINDRIKFATAWSPVSYILLH